MEGHWDADGTRMAGAIERVVGRKLRIWNMPWRALYLAAPLSPFFRELLEMRYLWSKPLRMPNEKLVAFLGEEPRTPLDAAVRRTLEDMRCLPTRKDEAMGAARVV